MTDASRALVTMLALSLGAGALMAAIFLSLLRQTMALSARQRAVAMTQLAFRAVWKKAPSRWTILSVAVGLFSSISIFLAGIAITTVIFRLMPLEVPHPTEPWDAIGDTMRAYIYLLFGSTISFVVALVTGKTIGFWVNWRLKNGPIAQMVGPITPPTS